MAEKLPAAAWPDVDLDDFYRQIVEYAAGMVLSGSRMKRELSDTVVSPTIEGSAISVRAVPGQAGKEAKYKAKGQPQRLGRFFQDPNLVAAHIATSCIEDWRAKWRGYKVPCADGVKRNTRDAAARYAANLVNTVYVPLVPRNRRRDKVAEIEVVAELLQRSRGRWPSDDRWDNRWIVS
jgi:hypothetical protein